MSEIDEKISTSGVIFGALIVQAGAKGDTGPQGEQGIQGIPGETGKDGKDYILTESDKQEIANNVKSSIQSTLDALSNKDASQDIEITDIKTKNNTQDARLDTLEADNTTNKENILNLQNDNTTNKTNIKSLQDDNEVNKTDISNIKQEQITQNTNIQELQTDNTSNKAKIELLEAKNAAQDKNIQKNTDNIEEINQKDSTQDNLIEELQTKVVELQNENTTLKNQIPQGEATGNPIHLSDSSDLECEIAVVGNSEQETRSGKNKLKLTQTSQTKNGLTIVVDKGKVIINGTATANTEILIYSNSDGLSVNGDYYFSTNVQNALTDTSKYGWINMYNGSTQLGYLDTMSNGKRFSFENQTITKINFDIKSGAVCNDLTFEFQLEPGTTKTDFEQYGESPSPEFKSPIQTVNGSVEIKVDNGLETTDTNYQSYTKVLPIQKEFVKINDTEDTFVKVEGKWYEAHYHPKIVFDGTENILFNASDNVKLRVTLQLDNLKENTNQSSTIDVLSNSFKGVSANNATTNLPINSISVISNKRLFIILNISVFSNVETFKTWLAEKYANGAPIIAYPTLKEPELIECTQEQIDILNSFYTYKGITNVSMSGIGTLKVNYKKDLETIINKLLATSVAE